MTTGLGAIDRRAAGRVAQRVARAQLLADAPVDGHQVVGDRIGRRQRTCQASLPVAGSTPSCAVDGARSRSAPVAARAAATALWREIASAGSWGRRRPRSSRRPGSARRRWERRRRSRRRAPAARRRAAGSAGSRPHPARSPVRLRELREGRLGAGGDPRQRVRRGALSDREKGYGGDRDRGPGSVADSPWHQ